MVSIKHGGDLTAAMAQYGGKREDWIDLSTGISQEAYPFQMPQLRSWQALPQADALAKLSDAAKSAYATQRAILPVPGAQAAIQHLPFLAYGKRAAILSPTYEEYDQVLALSGFEITKTNHPAALKGYDLVVVVNPNNPTGRELEPSALAGIADQCRLLLVDESFCDAREEVSVAGMRHDNLLVLRSFGKFYGLAGLRLGFVIGSEHLINVIKKRMGPWQVSGPALEIGAQALSDHAWKKDTIINLQKGARRLDQTCLKYGLSLVGGTELFRLYQVPEAGLHEHLAKNQIWSRVFQSHPFWLRLGIPGSEIQWQRLEKALSTHQLRS